MIKDLVCFECPIVSFIKVYDSIFYSLLTSESERSTLLLLEFQELVTAAPESGLCLSISSHGFSSFFLDMGPGIYFGTAGGGDFFSTQALASYFYQAIYSKDSSGGFIIIIIIREKTYKEETNFAMSTILVVLVSLSFESRSCT